MSCVGKCVLVVIVRMVCVDFGGLFVVMFSGLVEGGGVDYELVVYVGCEYVFVCFIDC